ncbi:MAG: Smr/MutS family protein [Bacilli bacterium]|nr:Smr/MutS family protein [Bacilli bacterium]MBQ7240976.1 Smr/MutS family protein [Bacilli bacterium]
MIQLYSNLPTLDLHGYDRDYARILINDFIYDNYKIKNKKVIIIHGNGTGIIKKTTQSTLRANKFVEEFHIDNFNDGMTIVSIRKKS